jgi:hypothetical protein
MSWANAAALPLGSSVMRKVAARLEVLRFPESAFCLQPASRVAVIAMAIIKLVLFNIG